MLSHRSFTAWLNGHNHAGNYGALDGRHFITFHGMVETPDTSAYAVVTLHPGHLGIEGFGREESRTLPLRNVT